MKRIYILQARSISRIIKCGFKKKPVDWIDLVKYNYSIQSYNFIENPVFFLTL